MSNCSVSILMQQTAEYLALGHYEQGLQVTEYCLQLQPSNSSLHLNKAVFQYKLGQNVQCLSSINQSIALDPLNYQAYFNLFSIQMESKQFQPAFKNLCCCLSVVHLLIAQNNLDQKHIQKAIQYSFNNKEARALRCLQKLKQGKKIEALNQINYALYLDPSHPQLIAIQKQVYQSLHMKELKTLGKDQKRARFQKLETCKEIPAADKIEAQITELLKEFNNLVKKIAEKRAFIVRRHTLQQKNQVLKHKPHTNDSHLLIQNNSEKLINVKKLVPKMIEVSEEEYGEICFAATCKQRESTVQGSEKHQSSIPETRHFMSDQSKLQSQHYFESSFDKLGNSSILDLSRNSRINVGVSEEKMSTEKSQSNDWILGEDKDDEQQTAQLGQKLKLEKL